MMRVMCHEEKLHKYLQSEDELETADPHAVYPTSTYHCCDGHVIAIEDASLIEGVMSTTLTTTIKILTPLGRYIAATCLAQFSWTSSQEPWTASVRDCPDGQLPHRLCAGCGEDGGGRLRLPSRWKPIGVAS